MTMYLNIHPNRLISDVQEEFNGMFPFLKLEFFRKRLPQQAGLPLQNILAHNRKIADGQTAITDGELEIKPGMTVKELEKTFKGEFSMDVQVFRHSGNIWLQTTMTDDWTLKHQNEHGKEISIGKVKTSEPGDFDLERNPG